MPAFRKDPSEAIDEFFRMARELDAECEHRAADVAAFNALSTDDKLELLYRKMMQHAHLLGAHAAPEASRPN